MKMNRLLKDAILGVMPFVCACLFTADAATLKVDVKGGAVTVTAPAGALDDASKIYLVWDTEDRGDEMSAWPQENRAAYSGTVSSAAATYTFDAVELGIPVGSKIRAFATSPIHLIDGWVSLGNGQYVDTGIKGSEAYGVDFKFRCTGVSTRWASVIGSQLDNFTIGSNASEYNKFYLRYRGNDDGTRFTFSDTSVPHTFRVFERKRYMDGSPFGTDLAEGSIGTDGENIFVGSSNHATDRRYCYGEWHYARILGQDGGDLRHLVAAVRGNASPEAGFYDTVSGEFFGNSGTETLTYDKSASVTSTTESVVFSDAASIDNSWACKTALWTGKGDRQNINDPNNWSRTELSGTPVPAVPDIYTFVKICGETTFSIPAGQTLSCAGIEFDNVSLAGDCDWSGIAAVELTYIDPFRGTWIDTGIKPNNKTRVVMDVTVGNTYEYWFGVWDEAYNKATYAVCNDGSNVYSGFGNSGGGKGSVVANGRHTIDFSNGVVRVDGVVHTDRSGQTFQLNNNLYLFSQNRNGSDYPNGIAYSPQDQGTNIAKFHSCKIYDGDTLVRDYVPARKGGTQCLYDRSTKTFSYFHFASDYWRFRVNSEVGTPLSDSVGESIDSTIDLAGRKLTLSYATGSGTITDTVGDGELWIDVPEGSVTTNATLSFTGSLKLVKDGAGTFVAAKADQTYTGGTVVTNGWAKSGAYNGAWGPAKALITIADGAAFDWAGKVEYIATLTPYSFVIEGDGPDGAGAMISSESVATSIWWQMNCIADMELSGDATIAMPDGEDSGVPGFMYKNTDAHNLTLNGHTLTIRHGTRMPFRYVKTIGPGTIANVDGGSSEGNGISVYGNDNVTDLSSATLDVGLGCGVNAESPFKVGTFIDRRLEYGVSWFKDEMMTILDTFRPMTANLLKTVTLGDATHLSPVLDLSGLDAPFTLPSSGCTMNMAEGATIKIKIGSRRVSGSSPVIAWSSENPPESVKSLKFALDDDERSYVVKVRNDGVYLRTGFVITVK